MSDPTARLLIVAPRMDSAALLVPRLAARDVEATLAEDPGQAIELAIDSRADAILIDHDATPGTLALCRQLKADRRTALLPVFVVAKAGALEDKLAAFEAGAADYLVKPADPAELLARLGVHLAAKRRIDRLETIAASHALDRVESLVRRDDQLFAKAAACLQQRLADPPALFGLARELGTNERKLTELFRERVGMTVFEYFAELRLETARRLLEGSDVRIQIIADRVGYSNAGDFTRAFRRRYEVSPREYRQTVVPAPRRAPCPAPAPAYALA